MTLLPTLHPRSSPRPTAASLLLSLLSLLALAGCANLGAPVKGDEAVPPPAAVVEPVPAQPPAAPTIAPALATGPLPGFQPALPPVPRAQMDPDIDGERIDLWARLRDGYAMPDLDGQLVAQWETWYASRPDYVQRMTERGGRYLFHIVEEVERRGMPAELALLPFIESAFNPQAMSSARASGMWQFMPATGRDFELRQNLFRDDRRNVLASTDAALDYLQRLHQRFGDWHLALAAYNWGQGNVQRAINRNQKAGLGTTYTDLKLPDETRNYVPKLQAVKNIVARPTAFSLVLPQLDNHPYFLSVAIERDIDVALAARLAGLSMDDFQQLNPQMNKPVVLAAGTPQVLLPYDNANQFVRGLGQHRGPLASWTAWVAQRNVKPAEVANLLGMSEAQLREVNRIPPRMVIKKGSTLLVPRSATADKDVTGHIADNAAIALAPEGRPLRRVALKARKGDTVSSIARRYKVSPLLVAQWNGVSQQTRFSAGESVVVMLAPPSKRSAKKRAAPHNAGKAAARSATKSAAKPAARPAAKRAVKK